MRKPIHRFMSALGMAIVLISSTILVDIIARDAGERIQVVDGLMFIMLVYLTVRSSYNES